MMRRKVANWTLQWMMKAVYAAHKAAGKEANVPGVQDLNGDTGEIQSISRAPS